MMMTMMITLLCYDDNDHSDKVMMYLIFKNNRWHRVQRKGKKREQGKHCLLTYKMILNDLFLEDLSTQTVTRVVVDIPSGGFPPHSRPSLQSWFVIIVIVILIFMVMIGH